jgi:DNA-binding transcriptional ArsR family regulator
MVKYSRLDNVLSALADPTRRAILERLQDRPRTIGELALPLKMSLPAVMKHIGILETNGLLIKKKVGRKAYCTLDAAPLLEVRDWLTYHEKFWNTRLDNLGRYLAKNKNNKHHGTKK